MAIITGKIYTADVDELLERVDFERLPAHIAFIMDGNRRWAKERGLPSIEGHRRGSEALRGIVTASRELGIKVMTIYAFSMENWRRSKDEVQFLMKLFMQYCKSERQLMKDSDIRFHLVGKRDELDAQVLAYFDDLEQYTRDCESMTLNVCINYGSRYEILRAAKRLAKDAMEGKVNVDDVDFDRFSSYLYTKGLPDPDLLIRTSGELRISNFLLWQAAYSEFWFTDVYWPDFSKKAFLSAIIDYQQRDRRFGGNTPQDKQKK